MSRETRILKPDTREDLGESATSGPQADAGPLDSLPRLFWGQVRLERLLRAWSTEGRLPDSLTWLEAATDAQFSIEQPEVMWRASGLGRPGLIVQLTAPLLATRLALGVEIPLAHCIVDRLLGYDRPFAQTRLQITPVEWGVWSFLVLRVLDALDRTEPDVQGNPAHVGPADLTLDRVGPDAFNPADLGSIVTIRWAVRVGNVSGAVRLWVPESVIQHWIASPAPAASELRQAGEQMKATGARSDALGTVSRGELSGGWRALAGVVDFPQGLRRLRAGSVLPFSETRLTGSPRSPTGPVDLIIDLDEQEFRFKIPTSPVADTGGRLLRLEAGMIRERRTRDPIDKTKPSRTSMSQPTASQGASSDFAGVAPLDVPVTVTVELGRVNLTLAQLAELKPGDVVELGRHSRAPVELTSNGRLVARGELVQIDTDLGVKVTSVFV